MSSVYFLFINPVCKLFWLAKLKRNCLWQNFFFGCVVSQILILYSSEWKIIWNCWERMIPHRNHIVLADLFWGIFGVQKCAISRSISSVCMLLGYNIAYKICCIDSFRRLSICQHDNSKSFTTSVIKFSYFIHYSILLVSKIWK